LLAPRNVLDYTLSYDLKFHIPKKGKRAKESIVNGLAVIDGSWV
jgi:hypothetical protein